MSATQAHQDRSQARIHPFSVASIALGLIGLLTIGIVGGLLLAGSGAVLGHLALHDIRWGKRNSRGRTLARVGLGFCYLAMLIFPLVGLGAAFSLPAFQELRKSRLAARSEVSQRNAARLYIACEQYARANRGQYPQEWSELDGPFLPHGELTTLLSSPYPLGGKDDSFELVPHERPILPEAASSVVVIQERVPPTVEKAAIVYANGKVDFIKNPDRF